MNTMDYISMDIRDLLKEKLEESLRTVDHLKNKPLENLTAKDLDKIRGQIGIIDFIIMRTQMDLPSGEEEDNDEK